MVTKPDLDKYLQMIIFFTQLIHDFSLNDLTQVFLHLF